jgi:hypothetical protein
MVVQLRPRSITVERGSRGFGLSLIYRGLDKYEEKDTGIFVARVVPGGTPILRATCLHKTRILCRAMSPDTKFDRIGKILLFLCVVAQCPATEFSLFV